jgi:hypothetical protein
MLKMCFGRASTATSMPALQQRFQLVDVALPFGAAHF